MLTAENHAAFDAARAKSQSSGKSLIEVLASEDMLLTPERRKQLIHQFMDFMIMNLEEYESPERVLRAHLQGKPGTATDMYFAMIKWLEDFKNVEIP